MYDVMSRRIGELRLKPVQMPVQPGSSPGEGVHTGLWRYRASVAALTMRPYDVASEGLTGGGGEWKCLSQHLKIFCKEHGKRVVRLSLR
jgi:hypothetical protein